MSEISSSVGGSPPGKSTSGFSMFMFTSPSSAITARARLCSRRCRADTRICVVGGNERRMGRRAVEPGGPVWHCRAAPNSPGGVDSLDRAVPGGRQRRRGLRARRLPGPRHRGTGAERAGVAGRLRLTLRDGTLVAANTGAPLDAAGVVALSTLRASGKREPAAGASRDTHATIVGRFGVGFAAAAAVSDEPHIASLTGAVAWSRIAAADLAREIPGVAAEISRRSGQLPVLRLPLAATGVPPAGFATAVTLPLRDEAAVLLVERLLAETGPALMLALPALAGVEIEVDGTARLLTATHEGDGVTISVDGVVGRWRTSGADGRTDERLLADRPAEERARPYWSLRWAVPVLADSDGCAVPAGSLPAGVSAVVHAPTPTDERLGLPALLLASFPLSPDRRHVAPGALTDFLLDRAAEVYAGLLPSLAPGPGL